MWQKLHREERSEDSGDDGHELDEDGRVSRGALAAEVAAFYVFFAVVPRAAGVGHEYGHHDSGDYGAAEESAERGGAERKSDYDGYEDCHEAGDYHFSEGRGCGDVYAAFVFGTSGAFHYAGDFSELAADFFYHFLSCAAYCLYRKGAEEEGEESSDEEAYHDFGVFEVYGGEVGGFGVGDEEGEGGVVLPTASRLSVMLRTSCGSSAISAMPPALSAMGP